MSSSRTDVGATAVVTMPQIGVSIAEGIVSRWRKRVGDWVEADETIVEISSDKIDTEVPAPASGRVGSILVAEGATVEVGTQLAVIETDARPGEAHADEHPPPAGAANLHVPPAAEAAAPVSPVVRRIAAEHGIDVATLSGSGRRGRVTKKDLLAHIERAGNGGSAPSEPVLHSDSPYREDPPPAVEGGVAPVPAAAPPGRGEPAVEPPAAGRPLSPMRRQIGERMVRSLQTTAQCTSIVEVDMSGVEAVRGRLSYLPFVARATVDALREHPALNATLTGDRLTVHEQVHLGVAVSLGDEGLIVPVVRAAHELAPEGLAARIADLAQRARSSRLSPDEVGDATFTITNPGRHGTLMATPIIDAPQVAILDLEAVVRRPVVVEGDAIAIRPMAYLCLSWDHRALDGVAAARFLASVKRNVEGFGR